MFKIYYRILIATWKTYGPRLRFLGWALLLPIFLLFTRVTLFLDNLFFPQYRQLEIKKPVFIVGNPRGGTTFLHLLLTKTGDFVSFETWQIFFPSLTARVLIKPIVDYLIKSDRTTIVPEDSGHAIYLNAIEHDEFIFTHQLDSQFVILLSPLAFDDQEHLELCFHDQQPQARRYGSVNFLKACLKRQMYYLSRERVICHAHYSTLRIKTLLENFPDAKFIYLTRSPFETIPSHLTLDYNVLKNQNRLDNVSKEMVQRYFKRRYSYDVEIYRYFDELEKNQVIPPSQVITISYEQLKLDLEKTIDKIADFAELELSSELREAIKTQTQNQGQYKRKHQLMSIEEFGISNEQIAADCSVILQKYGYQQSVK